MKETLLRSGQFAFRDRRTRKRDFRRLWIVRINAGARSNGLSYSTFMHGVKQSGVELDRKSLAELAFQDPAAFTAVVDKAKQALAA